MGSLEKRAERFSRPYCVRRPGKFRLDDIDPADTGGLQDRKRAK